MKNKQFVITSFSEDIERATEVKEIEIRNPVGSDVLVKNKFVGINAIYDRELYKGAVPYIDVVFPFVFGVEAVGSIVAVGPEVKDLTIGASVATVKVGSAYQEYQFVTEDEVIKIPEPTADYLTLMTTGVSAHLALQELAELRQGETVVVSAAAGGLGHIIVQLASMKGCKVVAICGSEKKKSMLDDLACCSKVINYRTDSVESILISDYGNKIDVAIDSVGKNMFDIFLSQMAPLGRLVVIGLASELSEPEFEKILAPRVYESIYWKGASVRCFMNHLYKSKHKASREYLFDLYRKQALQVKIDKQTFEGIESIQDASKYLLGGKSCGKVVVKL